MKMSKIRKRTPTQAPKQAGGGNGHKTNWLQLLKNSLAAIVADTGELQVSLAEGGFTDLLIDAIKTETALIVADTSEVQVSLAEGGFTDLLIDAIKAETALIVADTSEVQVSLADGGFTDQLIDAIKAETVLILADTDTIVWGDITAIDTVVDDIKALLVDGGTIDQLIDDIKALLVDGGVIDQLCDDILADTVMISGGALPADPVASSLARYIASGGTALGHPLPDSRSLVDLIGDYTGPHDGADIDDNIFAALAILKTAIDGIAGVNTYQEEIPDTDFALAAIDAALTVDPPDADAENSVVDIDAVVGATFVLRSLIVNVTALGTNGSKLTFGLWIPVNGAITQVDTVEVTATGFQNLMDLFGLPEVHGDSIHITVLTDGDSADAACSGTWKYAKANS